MPELSALLLLSSLLWLLLGAALCQVSSLSGCCSALPPVLALSCGGLVVACLVCMPHPWLSAEHADGLLGFLSKCKHP